jgi:RimJ/RimL family protein N-acetyltransferase
VRIVTIETPRLRLRPLTDGDIEPWVALFTDPETTRYVTPVPLGRETAEASFGYYRAAFAAKGYGWWAAEKKDDAAFAGAIMLQDVGFTAAFTPAIEVGWVLAPNHRGHGYATEGARAALDHAFTAMKLDEVVALTTATNLPSQRVMQRLGMTHDEADDFDHPQITEGPLRHCVLYRVSRGAHVQPNPNT